MHFVVTPSALTVAFRLGITVHACYAIQNYIFKICVYCMDMFSVRPGFFISRFSRNFIVKFMVETRNKNNIIREEKSRSK